MQRFMSVDPMADQRSWVSPYNYVQNNPLNRVDPTGAIDMDVDDWYEDGDGNIVYDQNIMSQGDLDAAGIQGTYLGEQGSGIDPSTGESISYNCDGTTSCSSFGLAGVTITGSPSGNGLATTSDGVGGLGAGMVAQGGSMRLTNGTANGNALSLKHYQSGWNGGSRAGIKTYQLGTAGKLAGKLGTAGTVGLGVYDIGTSAYSEGGFGTYTQRATGRTLGSIGGGIAGAKAGAAVGVWFGGWGAIPGGIIGGIGGSFGGSWLGEQGTIQGQKLIKP